MSLLLSKWQRPSLFGLISAFIPGGVHIFDKHIRGKGLHVAASTATGSTERGARRHNFSCR